MTDAYKRLNHEWIEWEDPTTHIPYYENTVTGEVSWDKPNIPEAHVQVQAQAPHPVVDTAAIEAARREAAEREAEQQRQAAAAAERERQREMAFEMQRQAAIKAEKERIEQEKARQQAEREAEERAEREALERAEQAERERQAAIIAERERQAKAAAEERARIEAERVRVLKQQQDLIEQQKRDLELQLQKLQQQQAALAEQAQVLTQQQQQLTTTPLQQQVAEVELQIDRKRGESQSFAAQIAKRAAAVQGTSAALSAGVPGTGSASVSSSPNVAQRSIHAASSIPNTHPGIVQPESLNRSSLTPTGGSTTPPVAGAVPVAGASAPLSFAEQLAAKLASKQQQQPTATPHLTGSITPQTLLASPPPPATNTGAPALAAAAATAAAPVATPPGSGAYPPPPGPNRSPPLLSSTINASAGGARVVSGVPGTPGYIPPPPRPGSASPAMGAAQPNQSSPTMAYAQFQPPPLASPTATATATTAAAPAPVLAATPVAPTTQAKSESVAVPVIQPPAFVRATSLSSSPPPIDAYTPIGNTPQRSSLSSSSTPTSTTTPTLRTSTSSTSTSTSSTNYEPVTPISTTGVTSTGVVQTKTTQPVASPKTDTRTAPKPPASQISASVPVTHHRDESLAEFSFASFSAKNFNPENRAEGGLFKKQGSISDLAVFTKQIAKPLIKQLPIPLHKDALQTFKNVTSYMGDRRSSKDGHGHATKLLYMGINTPGLRDEIYCQLIKQTTQNPRIESEMRGWELLSMCCAVFPPSQEFHHYLSVHLQQSESTEYKSRQAIADTAAYCRQMLPITMRRGNRLLVPSPNELTAMMSRRPVDVKVELLDETFQVVLAWPQMTVREFYDKLVGLLGYKLPTYHGVPLFGLYQVATDAGMFVMESPLGDETRIMDVVSGWYQGQKKALAKNANSQLQFKLIFKAKYFVHAYLTKEVLSEECLHLYYIQAAADVVSHHLHFPLYEAVKLAALMLRVAEFNGDLKDHIHKYISVRHINQELGGKTTLAKARASKKPVKELDALIAQVLGAYQPKREMTKSQAKRALLDACIKHPLYGCHTFAVTYAVDARPNDWERKLKKWGDTQPTLQAFTGSGKNALKEPEDVWLGLGEKGVVLIDKLTREVKRHDPLHTIAKYDYTKDTFFYYVKTIEYDGSFESAQQRVQAIRCEQAQAEKIVSLIEFYWRTSNQPGTAPAGVEKPRTSTTTSGTNAAPTLTSPTNASVAQVTAATAALNVNVNAQPVTVGQGSWLASPTAGTAASPYHNPQTLASPSSNGYANPMSPTASSTYPPPPQPQSQAQPHAQGYVQQQAQPQGYTQPQQAYPQQQQQQPQAYAQQVQSQAQAQAQAYAPPQQGYPAPPAQQARPVGYVQPLASPSMASRQFAPPPVTSPTAAYPNYAAQQPPVQNLAQPPPGHFGPPGPTYHGNNAPQIQ